MTVDCTILTPRDQRNQRNYSLWMLATMAAFVVATLGIDGAFLSAPAGWAATALTAALLLLSMRSYIVFLRDADELLRKIHLDALAFAFGTGIVVMMTYRLCERLGAPKLDVNDAALVMLMTWFAGQWIGLRRYGSTEE